MLPQLDPKDLCHRFSRERIDARRQCAARWMDADFAARANRDAEKLDAVELGALIDAARQDGKPAEREARLEAAAWKAVQTIIENALRPNGTGADWSPNDVDRESERRLARAVALYEFIVPRNDWPSVIVAASRAESRAQLAAKMAELGLLVPNLMRRLSGLGLVVVSVPPEPEILEALASVQGVAAMADPDTVVAAVSVQASDADEAMDVRSCMTVPDWAATELGKDAQVALLTGGVDREHPDLSGLPADRVFDVCGSSPGSTPEPGGRDDTGVGTALAAQIIGSGQCSEDHAYRGIAPNAKLSVLRVADDSGQVTLLDLLRALEHAVSLESDILVLPAGVDGSASASAIVRLACETLARQGRLVIAPAGDLGPAPGTVVAPGDLREAIAVGALGHEDSIAEFSGRGEPKADTPLSGKPDCLAPGIDVVVPRATNVGDGVEWRRFDDSGRYTLVNGTTVAAALLGGVAALVLSAARETHGKKTRAIQVRDAILDTCRSIEGASPVWEAGSGVPDVTAALETVNSDVLPALDDQVPPIVDTDTRRIEQLLQRAVAAGAAAEDGDDAAAVEALARDLMEEYDRRKLENDLDVEEAMAAETARGHIRLVEMADDFASGKGAGNGRPATAGSNGDESAGDDNESQEIKAARVDREDGPEPRPGDGTDTTRAGTEVALPPRDKVNTSQKGGSDGDDDARPLPTSRPRGRSDSSHDLAPDEDGAIEEGDLSHPDGIDFDVARKLEHEFLNGFEARLYTVPSVSNPLENGKRYDIHSAGETTSFFSDRDDLKRLLLDRGGADDGDMRRYPQNKGIEISLIRKKLFGPRTRKLAFVGACWSPMEELVTTGRATSRGTRRTLVKMVERLVTDPGCYYYIGIFSTTGWNDDARDANVRGNNYQVFILECDDEFGFRAFAAPDLDPVVRNAFDPEDELTKFNRVHRKLQQSADLKVPGGFLLIEELAEKSNVSEALALQAAAEYAQETAEVRIEKVDGTTIVRRKRF